MWGLSQRRSVATRLAPLAMMPAAAFAVHQLRYWLAFGDGARAVLARQGHAYLHSLAPWLVLLLALAAGAFLRALGRAFTGDCSVRRYAVSFAALWLACCVCLVVIYASQELLEGLLATGHPRGVPGIFGYGGWWAVPASVFVGLVLAALLHGARWVLRTTAERHLLRSSPRPRRAPRFRRPADALVPRPAPVAAGWSGRGPPR
jgi:hypothetical protein